MRKLLLLAVALVPLALAADPGRKLALVVGVNRYDGLGDLEYAVNDAAELAKVLGSAACGFDEVVLLTSGTKEKPTAANVRRAFEALLKKAKKADTVLIALAGHGVQPEVRDPKGDGEPKRYPFFCPSDANLTTIKYATGHSDTMINLDHLFDDLSRCNAGVKLVLMDACRNELKVAGRTRSLAADVMRVPAGVQALLSCGRTQVAFESEEYKHGLFFYHVLQGLRGKAKDDEGAVTWASLTGYATRNVTRDARKKLGKDQTPTATGYYEGETPVLSRATDVGSPRKDVPERPKVAEVPKKEVPERPKADGEGVTNSVGMLLAQIPAGEFLMGAADGEKGSGADERPRHRVKIGSAFHIGAYEVTQDQYQKVTGTNPSHFTKDGDGKDDVKGLDTADFPAENVSWDDAVAFCAKLSALPDEKRAGRAYRLPTEAEWEYCCRAGEKEYRTYHVGNELTKRDANFRNHLERTAKVGSYTRNAWGLYDMHGNVDEWCADRYDKFYYQECPVDDPPGPAKGSYRVMRGGSWGRDAKLCRSAYRAWNSATFQVSYIGFRVVMVATR